MFLLNTVTTFQEPDVIPVRDVIFGYITDSYYGGSTEYAKQANMVFDLVNNQIFDERIKFVISIEPRVQYATLQNFELQKLFAMREYSLNHVFYYALQPIYACMNHGLYPTFQTTKYIDWSTSPFLPQFNDNSELSILTWDQNPILEQKFLTNYDDGKSAFIVTSVFLQLGDQNLDNFKWTISCLEIDHDVVIMDSVQLGRKTGNFLHDFTTDPNLKNQALQVTKSSIQFTVSQEGYNQQHMSTIQFFGWHFCQVDSFEQNQVLKMRIDDDKHLIIGKITAYYDPDFGKQNNRFCTRGFMTDSRLTVVGASSLVPLAYFDSSLNTGQFSIDPDTFEIQIKTQVLITNDLLTTLGPNLVQFQLWRDFRDQTDVTPDKANPYFQFDVTFTVDNYCNDLTLANGQLALDSHQIDDSDGSWKIDYQVGMGVLETQITWQVECIGFLRAKPFLQRAQSEFQSVLSNSFAEFENCQIQSTITAACFYIDQQTNNLLVFAHPENPATQYAVLINAEFQGLNSSDQLIKKKGQLAKTLFVNVLKLEECNNAVIQSPFDKNHILIELNQTDQSISFHKEFNFYDSIGQDSLSSRACGQRKFDIRTQVNDENDSLTKSLLNCDTQKNHVCLKTKDNFVLSLDIQLNGTYPSVITLIFDLDVSLKYYAATQQAYQVIVKIVPQKILNFYPVSQHVEQNYTIGHGFQSINLQKYYHVDVPEKILIYEILETSQTFPLENYLTQSQNSSLMIQSNDISLISTALDFNVCAYTNLQRKDCNLTIRINFVADQRNTPPIFNGSIQTPNGIPCFGFDEASQWRYDFPKAMDLQKDKIDYKLKCLGRQNVFLTSFDEQILSLKLNLNQNDILEEPNLLCEVFLTDNHGATSKQTIIFASECFSIMNPDTSKNRNHVQPVATIRNISTSGEVLLSWNVNLRLLQIDNSSRNLQHANLECLKSALDVDVIMGSGSVYSNLRNLSFTQQISKFQSNQTTIKVQFDNPGDISTELTPDVISIRFKNQRCFTSMQGIQVNSSKILTQKLPRQKTKGVVEISEQQSTLFRIATNAAIFILVINFFLQGVLNSLLSSIESLGVLFHMFLVSLNYPLQMIQFFALLFPLITFDAIPTEELYEKIFKLSRITDDQPLTNQFEYSGYTSIFMIKNMGSVFLLSFLQLVFSIFLFINRRFRLFSFSNSIQSKLDKIANDTLWNGLIRFYSSNYLLFSVASFIESNNLRFGSKYSSTENFFSFLSVIGMMCSVAFPISIFFLYKAKTKCIDTRPHQQQKTSQSEHALDKLNEQEPRQQLQLQNDSTIFAQLLLSEPHLQFMSTYGVLIQGLKIKWLGRNTTIVTPVIDILMKLLITVSVTRLVTWPTFTIFVFNFAILIQTEFLLYFTPQTDYFENIKVCFNSVSFLLLNYHLFWFTNYTDKSMIPLVANSVIVFMWFCIGVNVFLTVPIVVYRYIKTMKQQYMRCKQQKRKYNLYKEKLYQLRASQAGWKETSTFDQRQDIEQLENKNCETQLEKQVETANHQTFISLDNPVESSEKLQDMTSFQYVSAKTKSRSHTQTEGLVQIKTKNSSFRNYQIAQLTFVEKTKLQDHKNTTKQKLQYQAKENESINEQTDFVERVLLNLFGSLPDESNPLVKQYDDDFYTDDTFQFGSKSKYYAAHLRMGKPEKSVQFFDTRYLSVQKAMSILANMTAPIQWTDFGLNQQSNQPSNSSNISLHGQNTQFTVILSAKSVLSNDMVSVREYFTDLTRRKFEFYIQDQLEAQFSVHKTRTNDWELVSKIEYLVKRMQLGVTPTVFQRAISGSIDEHLEWYSEIWQTLTFIDPFGRIRQLKTSDYLFQGQFRNSLTIIQKIALYEHIKFWFQNELPKWHLESMNATGNYLYQIQQYQRHRL